MTTDVMDLFTGEHQTFTCDARSAVIAAHAQSRNDWNTWDYEARYGSLVQESSRCFYCGNFGSYKTAEILHPA